MRAMLGCTLAAVFCLGTGLLAEDKKGDKIDPQKLVGKWEPKEKKKGKLLVRIVFTKDGKATATFALVGEEKKEYVGTYKLVGDELSLSLKFEGAHLESTHRIGKLTDTEMVWDYGTDSDTFVRAKDK
jgi:uncharacterized protein (TIGR03066 family)